MCPDIELGPGPGESQAEYDAKQAPAGKLAADPVAEAEAALAAAKQQAAAAITELPGAAKPLPAGLDQAAVGGLSQGRPEPSVPDMKVTHTEPVLTQGAAGDDVVRLVKLLAHAGYATNSVVNATNPHNVLDTSVMADVERFWNEHPEARESDELYAAREGGIHELQGSWVGPRTWQVLYDIAGSAG
jgi:hypothetical protein